MKKRGIPCSKWIWQGSPGHFIAGTKCVYHLSTVIGGHIISTVGEYRPLGCIEDEEVGLGRLYETMVFRASRCDVPGCDAFHAASGHEVDFVPANTRAEARSAHMAMCAKWSRR